MRYVVWTRHVLGSPGRFICPLPQEADRPIEAARRRCATLSRHAGGSNYEGVARVRGEDGVLSFFTWSQEDGLAVQPLPPRDEPEELLRDVEHPGYWPWPEVRARHGFEHGELVRLRSDGVGGRRVAARPGALARVDMDAPRAAFVQYLPVAWIRNGDDRRQCDGNYYPADFESACPRRNG